MSESPDKPKRSFSFRKLLTRIGPGLIAGASDDDPSAIGTYAMAGASLGYAILWSALFTMPLMIVVQYICAKIGLVTRKGVAHLLRENYSKAIAYSIVGALLLINMITAGVDIGAMAAALHLVIPLPANVFVLAITIIILAFQIRGSYKSLTRIFKWLTLTLFGYIVAAFFAHPNWGSVLRNTFIPTIRLDSSNFVAIIVALLGQALTPYMFFWQAEEEIEEKKSEDKQPIQKVPETTRRGRPQTKFVSAGRQGSSMRYLQRNNTGEDLQYAFWDVTIGMVISNLVMFFIILATGAALYKEGQHTQITTALDAAQALRPVAGDWAIVLFAVGLVGAGFLAVPVMTGSAAYAVSQLFGWRFGLDQAPERARNFYAVIVVTTLIAMLINFLNINPITALFWVSVISGILAVPLLIVIMSISSNKKIMGSHVNRRWEKIFGWATTAIMIAAVFLMVRGWLSGDSGS